MAAYVGVIWFVTALIAWVVSKYVDGWMGVGVRVKVVKVVVVMMIDERLCVAVVWGGERGKGRTEWVEDSLDYCCSHV